MKKSLFLTLSVIALITGCNQSEKPATEVVHETTVVHEVERPKAEPAVKSVEVDNKGVKINLQDKNGNSFEINQEHK